MNKCNSLTVFDEYCILLLTFISLYRDKIFFRVSVSNPFYMCDSSHYIYTRKYFLVSMTSSRILVFSVYYCVRPCRLVLMCWFSPVIILKRRLDYFFLNMSPFYIHKKIFSYFYCVVENLKRLKKRGKNKNKRKQKKKKKKRRKGKKRTRRKK